MASIVNAAYFQDETAAYAKLESIIWPNGAVCPHCGCTDRMKRMGGAATRPGLYKCYACRKQSRATVGTVFESSHVKLHVWLQAAYLMCSGKKDISSNQLARTLDVTVKTAWFMSHRLRKVMVASVLPPMGGGGAVVDINETFSSQKKDMPKHLGYTHKHVVLTLVERGKSSCSFHVDGMKATNLLPIIKANVAPRTIVMTDKARQYTQLRKHFASHNFTRHGQGGYVRGTVHTNMVEGYYSVFKRDMRAIYEHCAEKHLHRYLAKFDLSYNSWMRLSVDNVQQTDRVLHRIVGKRLTYKDSSPSHTIA